MSKKKKRTADRGPTFVGLSPIYEKTKQERIESKYKKHKGRQLDDQRGAFFVTRATKKILK